VTVDGTSYPLWNSEFWIKADNFKMVAASQSAAAQSPFSVNATTGQITFNGVVSFSSVTGTPTHTSGLLSARPVSAVLGSTYVATDESNKLYTYTATGWKVGGATSSEVVADINAGNTTTIDGGKITTGSITAGQINVDNLNASGLISASKLDVDNSSGFILKSEVIGSSITPNIQGGYIKGGTVEGAIIQAGKIDFSSSKFVNTLFPNNLGNLFIFKSTYTVNNILLFVGKSYSSGFLNNRCICNTQTFVLDAFAHFTEPDNYTTFSASITILAKIDGGAPFSIDSKSFSVYSVGDTMGSLSIKNSYSISNFNTIEFYGSTSTSGSLLTFSLAVYTQNME